MRRAPKRDAVVKMYLDKVPPCEIAQMLGVPVNTVYNAASHARDQGLLPKSSMMISRTAPTTGLKLLRYHAAKAGKHVGSMSVVADTLSPQVIKWLVSITPAGVPIALTVANIINDAFAEETEK